MYTSQHHTPNYPPPPSHVTKATQHRRISTVTSTNGGMVNGVGIGSGRRRSRGTGVLGRGIDNRPPPPTASTHMHRTSPLTASADVHRPPPSIASTHVRRSALLAPSTPSVHPPMAIPPLEMIEEYKGLSDDEYDASGKKELTIVRPEKNPTGFHPHTRAWLPRKGFEERAQPGPTQWSKVSKSTKNLYYEEFAKEFKWRKSQNDKYRVVWESICSVRYSQWMNKLKTKVWKKGLDKPLTMSAEC